MIKTNHVNVKGSIEQWLKTQYTDGLTNEFNTQPSLINQLKKENIVGDKREKHWAMGVTDNVTALGQSNDTYELTTDDFHSAGDTVKGEFDTTKIMGTFAITDEVIVRGSNNGAIFNVVKDSLSKMQTGLTHKMSRFVYGSQSGKIGVSTLTNASSAYVNGIGHVVTADITNSKSLLPGMGVMFHKSGTEWLEGRIWQKDNSQINKDTCKVIIKKASQAVSTDLSSTTALILGTTATEYTVYSRQLQMADNKAIGREYTGLEDIVMTQNNNIFGVDRSVYSSLNCTVADLADVETPDGMGLLTESVLRDLSDHISETANDSSNITVVASKARIVSTLEKQMYQYKDYSLDGGGNGFKLGRPEVTFDTWKFHKDKFSRDNNVYLLDPSKMGELLRKDWSWLTSGTREGVLERRDGTEIWEGIMNKYADMYLDEWRVHAAFKNVTDTYGA